MMRVHLERFGFGRDSTLGRLHVPGQASVFVLEDQCRPEGAPKVQDETAIPYGVYDITLRQDGGFHNRYAERFPELHEGMLWIRDVPQFEWILVHCGNFEHETSGCLLLGEVPGVNADGEFFVRQSEVAYRRIYPVIAGALRTDVPVSIKVSRQ